MLRRELLNYNRREKSLEELSKRFLSLFLEKDESLLSLDKITNQLGVERRRIYDIINILESLGVIYRQKKNQYQWCGLQCIKETINNFKKQIEIEKEIIDCQLNNRPFNMKSIQELNYLKNQYQKNKGNKKKSLGVLSVGFIRLFFIWKKVISLEQAARRLSTNTNQDKENKIKTKIRRLYDIANVFQSLGLIKKTQLKTRKPAFEWIGLTGLDNFIENLKQTTKQQQQQTCKGYTPNKAARNAFRSNKSAFKTPICDKTKSMSSTLKKDSFATKMRNLFSGLCETSQKEAGKESFPVFGYPNNPKISFNLQRTQSTPLQRKLSKLLMSSQQQQQITKKQRKYSERATINALNSQVRQMILNKSNEQKSNLFQILQTRRKTNVLIKRPGQTLSQTNSPQNINECYKKLKRLQNIRNQITWKSIQ